MTCFRCQDPEKPASHEATMEGEVVVLCDACLRFILLPKDAQRKLLANGQTKPRDESKVNLGMDTEVAAVAGAAAMVASGLIAAMTKIPTSFKVCGVIKASAATGKRVLFKCFPEKKAWVDLVGQTNAGLAVSVEIKSEHGPRFLLSTIRRERPHQVAVLDAAADHGGVAVLLVDFPDRADGRRHWYAVPWSTARRWMSVDPDRAECQPYRADPEAFLAGILAAGVP